MTSIENYDNWKLENDLNENENEESREDIFFKLRDIFGKDNLEYDQFDDSLFEFGIQFDVYFNKLSHQQRSLIWLEIKLLNVKQLHTQFEEFTIYFRFQ